MRNVLVTGGAGFIGCNFVRLLLAQEPDVRVVTLDSLTYAGSPDNLADLPDPSRHELVQGDIRDVDLVLELFKERDFDSVVNFAAETHVDRSIVDAVPFLQTNILGVYSLLSAANRTWKKGPDKSDEYRFLHVSTDEVYGSLGSDDPAFTETTPYRPNSPYAASKAGADHLVRAYSKTYGVPTLITNSSNNYGPFQYPEKLIPLMILNGLAGESMPLYAGGTQVRDWIHVEDHVEAVLLVLKEGLVGDTYHIGGGVQLTNLEVVRAICQLLDEMMPIDGVKMRTDQITYVDDRPGHDWRYAMDTTKIESQLDWNPKIDFQIGLRSTVEWYVSHAEWVEAIKNKSEYQAWLDLNYGQRNLLP